VVAVAIILNIHYYTGKNNINFLRINFVLLEEDVAETPTVGGDLDAETTM